MARLPARLAPLLAEIPVLAAVGVLAVVLTPAGTPVDPQRVTVRVASCDLQNTGSANVTYTVVNGDRVEHAYKVELAVAAAGGPLGAGVGLVNRVAPGATATGRALIVVRANPPDAACTVGAITHDGHAGHGS
ncbi:hypothetical protein ODJ79_04865 [Actinoplanes sp. KI2]|uniref:hypothetical protein n=1 Tax=Actinoplanes sp. KI2 TaxID=2983315 RepID=UPI0021D5E360|nr:hypothetical protein [Actinoplanes sp. KI2]MCU7723039.1 hypothetical protein [Actinoplanes sp. KI2]